MQCQKFTLALILGLAVLSYGHQASAQFGNLLKGVPGMSGGKKKDKAQPQPDESGGAAAPMGLNEAAAIPPLHDLGTDAIAVVEKAKDAGALQEMDYVFKDQKIELGKKGTITLSHLSGCLTEEMAGGTVTVAPGGSTVADGKRTQKVTEGCAAATPIIVAEASEAGATVNRITPFTDGQWNERTIKSAAPVFKWDSKPGPVTIRVSNMEQSPPAMVWEQQTDKPWLAYPASAPKLAPGVPHKVEVLAGGNVVASAYFSIDPGLDVADSLANRVVPVQVAGAH